MTGTEDNPSGNVARWVSKPIRRAPVLFKGVRHQDDDIVASDTGPRVRV